MLLESKVLLSNNFSHTNLLILLKVQTHKISFCNDGGLKCGHFDILNMIFPFLAFANLSEL